LRVAHPNQGRSPFRLALRFLTINRVTGTPVTNRQIVNPAQAAIPRSLERMAGAVFIRVNCGKARRMSNFARDAAVERLIDGIYRKGATLVLSEEREAQAAREKPTDFAGGRGMQPLPYGFRPTAA